MPVVRSKAHSTPPYAANAEAAKRARKARYNKSVKIFRRLHLYFGLALVPLVLLYGVMALLFNHSTWLSSATLVSHDPDVFDSIEFESPSIVADRLINELSKAEGLDVERSSEVMPVYRGDVIIDFADEENRQRFRIDPVSMNSTLRTSAVKPERDFESPFPKSMDVQEDQAVDDILDRIEREFDFVDGNVRTSPDLEFAANVDGKLGW